METVSESHNWSKWREQVILGFLALIATHTHTPMNHSFSCFTVLGEGVRVPTCLANTDKQGSVKVSWECDWYAKQKIGGTGSG